jgi:hypothetical protein
MQTEFALVASSLLSRGRPADRKTPNRLALGVSRLSSPIAKNIPVPFLFETRYGFIRLVPHEGRIAVVTDAG